MRPIPIRAARRKAMTVDHQDEEKANGKHGRFGVDPGETVNIAAQKRETGGEQHGGPDLSGLSKDDPATDGNDSQQQEEEEKR